MNIGIVTFHFALNYGAVLQAYALSTVLESMGHSATIIDYQPEYHTKMYKWSWGKFGLNVTNFVFPSLKIKFRKFLNTHLNLTPQCYKSLKEIRDDFPKFDALVSGSDQIWNTDITNFDPIYYLDFGDDSTIRIAYAASFGKTSFSVNDYKKLTYLFSNFDHISTREQIGADIVNRVYHNKAIQVLDPTLLINDYELVTGNYGPKYKYILLISLQNSNHLFNSVKILSKLTNLPIIVLNNYSIKFWNPRGNRLFPSPENYLSLIKNADFVITNSFHGTAFSLIFKKLFFTIALSGRGEEKNVRMTDLLDSVGLSKRFISTSSKNTIQDSYSEQLDWDSVQCQIIRQRNISLDFLKNGLI